MILFLKINIGLAALGLLTLIGACTSGNSPSSSPSPRPSTKVPQGQTTQQEQTQASQQTSGDQVNPFGSDSGGGEETDFSSILSGGAGKGSGGGLPGMPGGGDEGGGDPNQVKYVAAESFGLFTSPVQNNTGEDVAFSCPGDSFLTGEISKFHKEESDRTYRFECQFFQNGAGQPMRKTNCSLSNIMTGDKIDYTCPEGRHMAGQRNIYKGSGKNRTYQFECCEMVNPEEEKAIVLSEDTSTGQVKEICTNDSEAIRPQFRTLPDYAPYININVNERRSDMQYSCHKSALLPVGTLQTNFELQPLESAVMRSVRVDYDPSSETKDARHSYFCCMLKIE